MGVSDGLSIAQIKGEQLRRELRLRGRVDAEAVAARLGLEVHPWPFKVLQEMQVDGVIAVAQRLDPPWRRWVTAHAMGHWLLHPGNHLRLRRHMQVSGAVEQEAEEFARALLVDGCEAVDLGLTRPWEIAEYFGVPEEMVRLHAPLTASSFPAKSDVASSCAPASVRNPGGRRSDDRLRLDHPPTNRDQLPARRETGEGQRPMPPARGRLVQPSPSRSNRGAPAEGGDS